MGALLPDPGSAGTVDDVVAALRALRGWAGNPSHEVIRKRVNAAWTAAGRPAGELVSKTTVVDCFRAGRRRLNTDLVLAVVAALRPDDGYLAQWRQALRAIGGEAAGAAQVRAQDTLPADLAEFTGRSSELDRLRRLLRLGIVDGGAVVISAIEGMAGVGKTQLAIHAGHLLAAEDAFERVLFVNLRGFHPDPGQPPAEPAAVLDGFLRLLGVPGRQIPHDLAARAALYQRRLAGVRALVVLDNAATEDQVQPLLPDTPGCLTLVTSRRRLTGLHSATYLSVDVFTADEAIEFLKRAAPDIATGEDPDALARVTRRCGYLPLALGLIAGHMRANPDWTLTDHADRLDERHRNHRLDTGVQLALDLSYQHLPADRRRLFRLLALQPGHDIDAYAAAALSSAELDRVGGQLEQLCAEHLLRQVTPGRFIFHDLVRGYATGRASDEDRPAERRAALTRLFDHYLHTATVAMDILHPAERHRRPRIPPPATPVPALVDPATALAWLDAERATLIAVAGHAATDGWPDHTTRLAATVSRYLNAGGHYHAAETLHTQAREAARHTGDRVAEAEALNNLGAVCLLLDRYQHVADHLQQATTLCREVGDRAGVARALTNLGIAYSRLGRYQQAADHHRQAITLLRKIGDRSGEAYALDNLGVIDWRLGRYQQATDHLQQALTVCREIGDRYGEAAVLTNLGTVHRGLGRYQQATDHLQQALTVCREIGDRSGEAYALDKLGAVHRGLGRYQQAADHFQQAITVCREIGNRSGEASALTNLGTVHRRLGHYQQATDHHQQALTLCHEIGDRAGQTSALNGLGETLHASGRPDQATAPHATALALATDIGDRYEQARAHHGLAHIHHATGEPDQARHHWHQALALFTEIGVPEAEQARTELAALGKPDNPQ